MSVRSLLSTLGKERGITIEPDELDALGLSEDGDDGDENTDLKTVDLSLPLPGKASAQLEVFLAAGSTKVEPLDEGGLIWEPIMRAGQWALRPDGRGGKKRLPLKIIAGHSENQNREIGLADVEAAFNDGAVEHVTVPETHENKATQNHGYIEKVKIVKGRFKGEPVDVFMGGYNFTEPDTRAKVLRGSVPSRSAGLLYGYERTDTGKTYPVALEHVALTPKPWLRGMPRFGRALEAMSEDIETIALTLSDDGPTDKEYEITLSDPDAILQLADPITWTHEDSPQWLQEQVNNILRAKRVERLDARKITPSYMVEESLPSYRCREAKPGLALIADSYGDDANFWVAPISVVQGEVQIADVSKWSATKKVWIGDTRPVPTGDKAPLADDSPAATVDPLKLAQDLRRERGVIGSTNLAMTAAEKSKLKPADYAVPGEMKFPIHTETHAKNALARAAGTIYHAAVKKAVKKKYPNMNIKMSEPTPRGGGKMADPSNTLQLSEEARALISAAEAKATAAEQRATSLAETVDRLVGTVNAREADTFIAHMKAPVADGGLGLSEERGFSGMLRELHAILLADDGGPAVQSDHFADDKNTKGTLSLTDAFKRVFGALRTAEGSILKLGEVVRPPTEKNEDEELDTKGKPGKGDPKDETNLSDDELLKDVPESMLAGLGISKPSAPEPQKAGDKS